MKVRLAMVMSLDGKTTHGEIPGTSTWASSEDHKAFKNLVAGHDCIVMGSRTYAAAREFIRPSAEKPRIILTKNPEKFAEDHEKPGITFMSARPREVIAQAAAMACQNVLLAGGAETNAQFFDAGLVDEVYLTVEPVVLGSGLPLMGPLQAAVRLRLMESTTLNDRGTVQLHYQVVQS
jgi:dihydrofolate reductase